MILAAICLHLIFVGVIFLVGRLQLLPSTFDVNGTGISFAIDCHYYRIEAAELAKHLHHGEISSWLAAPRQFHVKLYSVSFAVFGPIFGFNILSAAPLNILCYLLILYLVFKIGREVFDERVGKAAAAIVAVWPSFLLHTTQMLRDPLFIAAVLLLVLTLSRLLTKIYLRPRGLLSGIVGGAACTFLWLVRGDMWEVVVIVVLIGAFMLVVRQLVERRILTGNLIAALVLIALVLLAPRMIKAHRQTNSFLAQSAAVEKTGTAGGLSIPSLSEAKMNESKLSSLATRVGLLRHRFSTIYPLAGSNIDTEIKLKSIGDIIEYFPRAMSIGYFAPFPSMWFSVGAQVGREGRLLSGLETLTMYVIEGFAVFGLWRARRRLAAWLLILIVTVAVTALGFVVVNISTLYRMRYAFWMLLIILGVEGGRQLLILRAGNGSGAEDLGPDLPLR